jgi:hypothetical protein
VGEDQDALTLVAQGEASLYLRVVGFGTTWSMRTVDAAGCACS